MVVRFIVNKTGEVVERRFDSPFFAEKFIKKLKYSKRCTLTSYWRL